MNSTCGNSKSSATAWLLWKIQMSSIERPSLRNFYQPRIKLNTNLTKTKEVTLSFCLLQLSHISHTQVCRHYYTVCQETIGFSLGKVIHCGWIKFHFVQKYYVQHQPPVAEGNFGHAPVYILRVLRAGTNVTASDRFWFWSWPPLLWRNFCRCLSSWRFFFSCRCCSFLCLLDTWEWGTQKWIGKNTTICPVW